MPYKRIKKNEKEMQGNKCADGTAGERTEGKITKISRPLLTVCFVLYS